MHLSDASTADSVAIIGEVTGDGAISCATTADWTQQRRKPRQRTGRRATRSSRLRDMQELSSVLAYEASSEQEFEAG